jgi:hypothetical protein
MSIIDFSILLVHPKQMDCPFVALRIINSSYPIKLARFLARFSEVLNIWILLA